LNNSIEVLKISHLIYKIPFIHQKLHVLNLKEKNTDLSISKVFQTNSVYAIYNSIAYVQQAHKNQANLISELNHQVYASFTTT